MVYLSVLAGPSQICAKMVYSNRVSITSFQVKDMGVGGQTLFWRSPLSRWHLYVIYPGLNRNDWKSMRWGEEEQEENVACCRYPGVLSEPWESSQGTAQGYLPGWTMASAQLTVPGRASLWTEMDVTPALLPPCSVDFEILIVLKVWWMSSSLSSLLSQL